MKQLEVDIMGQSYLLTCPEQSEAMLQQAAERVDNVMCRIRDGGKAKVRDRIAVLAALNLAFELAQNKSGSTDTNVDADAPPEPADNSAAQGALLSILLQRLDNALLLTQPSPVSLSAQTGRTAPLA